MFSVTEKVDLATSPGSATVYRKSYIVKYFFKLENTVSLFFLSPAPFSHIRSYLFF
jgi:hypothetical protein